MSVKTLLIIVNEDQYFVSHRMEIARGAIAAGWRVVVAAAPVSGCRDTIEKEGIEFLPLPLHGDGMNLNDQIATLRILIKLFQRHRHAVLHLVGMKMLLVGNVAARIAGFQGGIVNAVCGLGSMFRDPQAFKPRLLMRVLRSVWRRHNVATIVQNHDDEQILIDNGVIDPEEVVYIKGAGTNLKKYGKTSPKIQNRIKRVIFTGRLLRSKGVTDLVEAAEMLRAKWEGKVEFMICGGLSSNHESLKKEDMDRLCDGRYIVWTGLRNDIPGLLADSDIMAFPSYYREGVPLSLIEASASGLPIITCDSVGCRDTVDGNGFTVPPRSPQSIADKIDLLLSDESLRCSYGRRSRELAERDYDIRNVVHRHLNLYSRLAAATAGVAVGQPAAHPATHPEISVSYV